MKKSTAKLLAERVLLQGGPASLVRISRRGRSLVLAYHNVVPEGHKTCGDLSLHLSQESFAAQLDTLVRRHEVVPLCELLETPGGAGGGARVAITFDDAYRGAVTAGVEELAKRGLPATVFVAPDFVGGASFWWDVLPNIPRERALDEFRGRNAAVRDWAREERLDETSVNDHGTAASEEELRTALAQGGITLGSHSWSHPNLARLDSDELMEELVRPLRWLQERFTDIIPWLSYPYGLASPRVERAAASAGYEAALRIAGGWFPRRPDNLFGLPRLNIPAGMSLSGFDLRISGLFCG
jgi:peptidoglycan/xylan/chitin deacetylase (PgdA/CDA1 family)